mgnify:CR=1 FL=1
MVINTDHYQKFHDEFCEACEQAEDFYVIAWNEQEAEYQEAVADEAEERRKFLEEQAADPEFHNPNALFRGNAPTFSTFSTHQEFIDDVRRRYEVSENADYLDHMFDQMVDDMIGESDLS